jgi:hypothetical protein
MGPMGHGMLMLMTSTSSGSTGKKCKHLGIFKIREFRLHPVPEYHDVGLAPRYSTASRYVAQCNASTPELRLKSPVKWSCQSLAHPGGTIRVPSKA